MKIAASVVIDSEGRKPQQFSVGDTVMYRKKIISNKAHFVIVKILLIWSEHRVIIKFKLEQRAVCQAR